MQTRTNQTEIAVLGGLAIEPMSGYALRQAIRDVLGHFWSESFGQIYPALARLQRAGHVTRRGTGRPGVSRYAITPSGRTRLVELLGQPIQSVPPRNGLLLRLFFGRQLGNAACRVLIEGAKREAERRLADLAAVRRELEANRDRDADRPYFLLTVSAGEHATRATIAWAEGALADLEAMERSPHPSPQPS